MPTGSRARPTLELGSGRAVGPQATLHPGRPPTALVTHGVYARSRNPIYLADAIILAGLCLIWQPLAALVLCGAHRADRVMIAGRWTVVDGQPIGVDLARLRAEHGAAARRFLEETA